MSKSLGNFFRLREAFATVEPEAVRYALLTVHYRSPFNLEMDLDDAGALLGFPQFREAESRLSYIYSTLSRYRKFPEARVKADKSKKLSPELVNFPERVSEALDLDLNSPQALAAAAGFLKAANEALDAGSAKGGALLPEARAAIGLGFEVLGGVLGLGADEPDEFLLRVRDRRAAGLGILPAWVQSLLEERARARADKNFARGDEIRNELLARGVEILDSPDGTSWRLA